MLIKCLYGTLSNAFRTSKILSRSGAGYVHLYIVHVGIALLRKACNLEMVDIVVQFIACAIATWDYGIATLVGS